MCLGMFVFYSRLKYGNIDLTVWIALYRPLWFTCNKQQVAGIIVVFEKGFAQGQGIDTLHIILMYNNYTLLLCCFWSISLYDTLLLCCFWSISLYYTLLLCCFRSISLYYTLLLCCFWSISLPYTLLLCCFWSISLYDTLLLCCFADQWTLLTFDLVFFCVVVFVPEPLIYTYS